MWCICVSTHINLQKANNDYDFGVFVLHWEVFVYLRVGIRWLGFVNVNVMKFHVEDLTIWMTHSLSYSATINKYDILKFSLQPNSIFTIKPNFDFTIQIEWEWEWERRSVRTTLNDCITKKSEQCERSQKTKSTNCNHRCQIIHQQLNIQKKEGEREKKTCLFNFSVLFWMIL